MSGTSENNDNKEGQPGAGNNDAGKEAGTGLGFKSIEDAEAEIKKLRKESADRRVKGKTQEDELKTLADQLGSIKKHLGIKDDVSPEETIKDLQTKYADLELKSALRELAFDNGIGKEDEEYFNFLISKKFESLKDDEELPEAELQKVVDEVKAKSKGKAAGSTGVNDASKDKNPDGGAGETTVEQFVKMSTAEKQELFNKNQGLYDRLFNEAASKRLL